MDGGGRPFFKEKGKVSVMAAAKGLKTHYALLKIFTCCRITVQ